MAACLPGCLPSWLAACLPACLPTYLPGWLPVCLPACLPARLRPQVLAEAALILHTLYSIIYTLLCMRPQVLAEAAATFAEHDADRDGALCVDEFVNAYLWLARRYGRALVGPLQVVVIS